MTTKPPENLWQLLGRSQLSDLLGLDFVAGVAAGVPAGIWAIDHFGTLVDASNTAANLVGAVIGVSVGAAALVAAFLNPEFLRKIRIINKDPLRYLAPFLLTAALGVLAGLSIVGLPLVTEAAPGWLHGTVGGLAAGLVVWTLLSTLRCLSSLIAFVRLQAAAADVDPRVTELKKPDASSG